MRITEIALAVLKTIRKLLGKEIKYTIPNINTLASNHDLWSELLKTHVQENGLVDYQGFATDKKKLQDYATLLSNNPPSTQWIKEEQLAYWINAYNAFTVLLVVNHYPIKSIKDIAGNIPMINSVWDLKFFKIGDFDFDLTTIEHEILRKLYDEPRIHFAINCASISCPKLRNEAFTAENLEAQLEAQAFHFINNPSNNIITQEKVQLSKIFEWFKSDFAKEKTLFQYLENYLSYTINENAKVEYIDYDWNLNKT